MSVKANCIVELQVECNSTWGEETTMSQILSQAVTDARQRVHAMFDEKAQGVRFVRTTKVMTNTVTELQRE